MPKSIKKVIEPKMNMDKIKFLAILLLALHLISSILNFIQSFTMTTVSNNFAQSLRSFLN